MRSKKPVLIEEKKNSKEKENNPPQGIKKEVISSISNPLLTPFHWNGYDVFLIMILVILGTFSRFWIIQYPRHLVSFESNQIHVLNSFLNGSLYVDKQPPFGSYILSQLAKFSEYDLSYEMPRTEYNYTYHNMKYVSLRSIPAFFSTLTIPISYFIVRSFGGNRFTSFSTGLFVMFDFLLISLGRHCFTDGLLQFFISVSVLFSSLSTHFKVGSIYHSILYLISVIFSGFSLSTNLNAFGVCIFSLLFSQFRLRLLLTGIIIPIFIFFISFSIQVISEPYKSEHSWSLPQEYQDTLLSPGQIYNIQHKLILRHSIELIKEMFRLRQLTFVDKSEWYLWPIMGCKWNILWTQMNRFVSSFGNFIVWGIIFLIVIYLILKMLIRHRIERPLDKLCVGYVICLIYYIQGLNERAICDYEISDLFGLWLLALFIETEFNESVYGFVLPLLNIITVVIFYLWSPLVYGYEHFDQRFLPYFAK